MTMEQEPSAATQRMIDMFAEETRSRLRPAGIDDWRNAIGEAATRAVGALRCRHPHMIGDTANAGNSGYVYVIQAEGGGLVKIGRARDPRSRVQDIQATSPVRLEVVAVMDGPELERIWHVKFYKLRVHAEWFAPEVAEFFRAHDGCVRCAVYKDGVPLPPPRTRCRKAAP